MKYAIVWTLLQVDQNYPIYNYLSIVFHCHHFGVSILLYIPDFKNVHAVLMRNIHLAGLLGQIIQVRVKHSAGCTDASFTSDEPFWDKLYILWIVQVRVVTSEGCLVQVIHFSGCLNQVLNPAVSAMQCVIGVCYTSFGLLKSDYTYCWLY